MSEEFYNRLVEDMFSWITTIEKVLFHVTLFHVSDAAMLIK